MAIVLPGTRTSSFGGPQNPFGGTADILMQVQALQQRKRAQEAQDALGQILSQSVQEQGGVDPTGIIADIFAAPGLNTAQKLQGAQAAGSLAKMTPKPAEPLQIERLQTLAARLPEGSPQREQVERRINQLAPVDKVTLTKERPGGGFQTVSVAPDQVDALVATGFERGDIKGVPTTPLSNVSKLIRERDALPPNDPTRQILDQAISKQVAQSGERITVGPDGSVSIARGKGVNGGIDLQKSTKGKIEGQILDTGAKLARLKSIEGKINDEFLRIPTQLATKFSAIKERVGFDLSPEDKKRLDEFTAFKSSTVNELNRTIKEITGAAMNKEEVPRILGEVPSAADSPTEFRSKVKESIRRSNLVMARLNYIRSRGFEFGSATNPKSKNYIDFESIPQIMNSRGAELLSSGLAEEDVRKQLAQEFGLVQ